MSYDSVDFLNKAHPLGPWCLTSIDPEQKKLETRTFYPPEQVDDCLKWLEENNERNNIYWHVNPVLRAITKKAQRTDIKELAYLHVDIDSKSNSDEDKEKLLRKLLNPPVGIPLPTIIISSGGGYQAFWKLKNPLPIGGELEKAEQAKRYNMQLEVIFGADNCHNVDRLCRLPGTLNIPNEVKRKRGRKPVWAETIEYNPDRIYNLSEFSPLPLVQGHGITGEIIEVTGNVRRLNSIDELSQWNVADRIKVIAVQGTHPDEVKVKDNSRSSWLFDCLCGMVRAGVPEEVMFAVVTDPGFGISESVLDKGANSEKYATRQIKRAIEEAVNPWLRKLNDQFTVISNVGGKCRVAEECMDYGVNRPRLTFQSFSDFRNRYLNQNVEVGVDKNGNPRLVSVGDWWLKHPQRKQYETVVFSPGREIDNCYNLWKGYGVEPLPGENHLGFLKHIQENICENTEEYYDYILKWMARAVQKPDSPGQTAIVLRGRQGTGKSFFANQFGHLFGRHYMQVSDPKHLVGSFNAHLRDCVLLFGDEAFYAGDKKHESVLKTLITEDLITIEAKGIDAESSQNCTHVILASNNNWVVPAGADERRFFVLDVGTGRMQNSNYFRKIAEELKDKGYNNLLYYLLKLDISDFNVRIVPKTMALLEQKIFSLNADEEWWYNKLQEGLWKNLVPKDEVYDDYINYLKQIGIPRRSSQTSLMRFLQKVCAGRIEVIQKHVTDIASSGETRRVRKYCYKFPTITVCRSIWDQLYNTNIPWNRLDPGDIEDVSNLTVF